MKKTLFILSVILFAIAAKVNAQQLTIKNETSCTVYITLYAHDDGSCISSACSTYVSNTFAIASLGQQTFSQESDVNDAGCSGTGPGWIGGLCYCSGKFPTSGSYGWDGVEINEPSFTSSDILMMPASSCLTYNMTASPDCGSSNVSGTWNISGGVITVTIRY